MGQQFAGRVGLFLRVDDFDASYQRMTDAGVRFILPPRDDAYGQVAVFVDLEGNKWEPAWPGFRAIASAATAMVLLLPAVAGYARQTRHPSRGRAATMGGRGLTSESCRAARRTTASPTRDRAKSIRGAARSDRSRTPSARCPDSWRLLQGRLRGTLQLFGAMADALKAGGIATWNILYRRLGDPGSGWPGTYLDVGRAVNHVRVIAGEHRLNLARVVVVGHSAGGRLAMWAAARGRLPAGSDFYMANPLKVRGVVNLGARGHDRQHHGLRRAVRGHGHHVAAWWSAVGGATALRAGFGNQAAASGPTASPRAWGS